MKQHFRGVIWPRQNDEPDKGIYRYTVVGLLVTDKPLENLSANQIVLDGNADGMAEVLEAITQKEPKVQVGDATDVLLKLKDLTDGIT
jgi:hypothetical protein